MQNANKVYEILRPLIDEIRTLVAGVASSAVLPQPSWLVSDWYVNPVTGNDADDGLTPATAVKTIMGGIVFSKWKTEEPTLIQNTTIHLLDTETLGQEDVVLRPVVARGVWFAVVGTPKLVASLSLGAVTPKTRGKPGQLLQAAGFTAAGLAVGQLVVNTTAGKASKSWIRTLAAGVATLAQPLAPLTPAANAQNFPPGMPPEVDTWAMNDTVQVFSVPLLNLKVWKTDGGDATATSFGGASWLQGVQVPDWSGVPGNSYFGTFSTSCVPWFVDCKMDAYNVIQGMLGGGIYGGFVVNCYWSGGGEIENGSFVGGVVENYGLALGDFGEVDGDAICHELTVYAPSSAFIGEAYAEDHFNAFGGGSVKLDQIYYGATFLWGPAPCALTDRGTMQKVSTQTWVQCLLLAPLSIEGAVTGTSYAAGVWTDGIALTTANLDANSTLQNPRTGSKFFLNS